jgi:hypothetical protein
MKYCIDCKHVHVPANGDEQYSTCGMARRMDEGKQFISPRMEGEFSYCSTQRGQVGACGSEAKLFEPKELQS